MQAETLSSEQDGPTAASNTMEPPDRDKWDLREGEKRSSRTLEPLQVQGPKPLMGHSYTKIQDSWVLTHCTVIYTNFRDMLTEFPSGRKAMNGLKVIQKYHKQPD